MPVSAGGSSRSTRTGTKSNPSKSAGAGELSSSAAASPSTLISCCNALRHSLPYPASIASPERDIVTRSESTSLAVSMTSRTSAVALKLPCRTSSSTVSNTWANSTSAVKPKIPAPPFTE
jgi:hypothetical protein